MRGGAVVRAGTAKGGRVDVVRYRASVAYVGTGFRGFQLQHNAARTVQSVLEEALGPVSRRRPSGSTPRVGPTRASTPTDRSSTSIFPRRASRCASARASTRCFRGTSGSSTSETAPEGFLARRDAVWKEYLYRWSRAAVIPPTGLALRRADLARGGGRPHGAGGAATSRAGATSACSPCACRGTPERCAASISPASRRRGTRSALRIRGDAFLRGMVRSICGVLAHVGRGRAPVTRIAELLETGDRGLLAPKAPACGLTLVRVHYPGEPASPE